MISTATRNRNFDLALEHAERLCALPERGIEPGDRVVHRWLLARLYMQRGRTADATRELGKVVAAYEPRHTELARLELARIADEAMSFDRSTN